MYVNMNSGAVQAGLMPFRNALINGDMRINQRGTSTNLASLTTVAAATPGSWVTDRWNVLRGSFAAGGVMGQGTSLTNSDLPFSDAGIKTFARVGRLSGNTATNAVFIQYNMESQDCYQYAGKTVTLSFYYRTGTNFSGSVLSTDIFTGTSTDQAVRSGFTGSIAQTTTNIASSIWRRISFTVTLSSLLNQIGLNIQYIPVGTAGTNDYFDITGIQLELGSVPTSFEVRPYPVELQMCQRYSYVISNAAYPSQTYTRFGMGSARVATVAEIRVQHPVTMRKITQVTTVGTLQVGDTTSGGIATSISIYTECTSVDATVLTVGTSGGLTAFRPYYLESANTTATLILNAEI
jgi:hypothetical protein